VTVSQSSLISKIVKEFGLAKANPRKLPMSPSANLGPIEIGEEKAGSEYASLIGSLLFLANATRPDIAYSVNALSAHMGAPARRHFDLAKGIVRYCIGR
jgi:hypothetical protein